MLKIEVVAVLVAKRAEECSKGTNVFLDRGTHPDPDRHRAIIVAKTLTRPVFANVQGDASTRMGQSGA